MNNANHLAPYGRTEDFQPRIGSELEHRLRAVSLGPAPDKKTKQAFRQRSFALRAMRPRLHGRIGYKLQD